MIDIEKRRIFEKTKITYNPHQVVATADPECKSCSGEGIVDVGGGWAGGLTGKCPDCWTVE